MRTVVLDGGAHSRLAAAVAQALGLTLASAEVARFPDGESRVHVAHDVAGARVVIVQPLGPPVNEHLVELLLTLDAVRRAGAGAAVAVIAYAGYARQDRRGPGEAVGIRVVGDALRMGRPDRVLVVDPHTQALEAAFGLPVDYVSAAPLLAERLRDLVEGPAVIVAPDLGAAKLADQYASILGLPTAVVRKRRLSGLDVEASELVGEVAGLAPIIVDDMLSTGGTVAAAGRLLLERGCVPRLVVAATHALFVAPALERLSALPVARMLVTDTLPPVRDAGGLPLDTVAVAPALAATLRRFLE